MRSVLASAAGENAAKGEERGEQQQTPKHGLTWPCAIGSKLEPAALPWITALQGFFVTGTDTDVGKTLVSAWLMTHLDADYWKPVQAGTEPETDSVTVRRLAEISADRILPEAYVLPEAMAPHEAARRAGISIDMAKLRTSRDEPPAGG